MGRKVCFLKNNFNKGLKELIFENYASFKQWYLEADSQSIKDQNRPYGNEELKRYLRQDSDIISDFNNLDGRLIDLLTSEFIGEYCDLTDKKGLILECFGPVMSTSRYYMSSDMVEATKDPDFIRLWDFLLNGRSLKNNEPFGCDAHDRIYGFLTFDEHQKLKTKIEQYFGTIEKIREKYWTDLEKTTLANAIGNSKDSAYFLSDHAPVSSGLEYVLEVLDRIGDTKNELISEIS